MIDSGNQAAHDAALDVAVATQAPLMIYSSAGMGKTHLLQAIGNKIDMLFPQNHVIYIHAQRYALYETNNSTESPLYDKSDVLMLDGIEYIAGKWEAQKALLASLRLLIESGKKIVLTSNQHPQELSGIDPQLKDIFGSGLMVTIWPPSLELKYAFVMKQLRIDESLGCYIAARPFPNMRNLVAVVCAIRRNARMRERHISVELVEEIFAPLNWEH